MAKAKSAKGKGVTQKHLHSRISFLYQAATYLESVDSPLKAVYENPEAKNDETDGEETRSRETTQPRHLLTQLWNVALKSQIRLSPKLKHTMCKRCNGLLTAPRNSVRIMENESRDGTKPWADVLVIKCQFCGTVKRFPVGQVRRKKEKPDVLGKQEE